MAERIEAYRLHGLRKAESHFALRASGTLQERCRRIEQAAWDRIYRENLDQLPPLERSLADWEAREADQQLTRMRLVEHFTSVSGHYLSDQPDFDRFAEMVLLVEEAIGWIEASPWNGRPSLGPQRVELSLGAALAVQPEAGRLPQQPPQSRADAHQRSGAGAHAADERQTGLRTTDHAAHLSVLPVRRRGAHRPVP